MTRSGVRPKGSKILDTICHDRIPKKERHVVTAILEKNLEGKTEAQKKKIRAMAKARAARSAKCAEIRAKKEADPNWKEEVEEKDEPIEDGEILTSKERKLKDDLMWVLQKMGGRNKILQMAKKSDALKVVIIKELLRVEVKELEARLRSKEAFKGGNQPGFFFVVKGLEDMKKVNDASEGMKFLEQVLAPQDDKTIDLGEPGENN